MKTKKKEIVRYLIVSPFEGATDIGIYYLLIHFLPNIVAKAISYVIANGIGYVFNKYWIFKKKKASAPEAARYFMVDILLFAGNILINQAILSHWPKAVFLAIVITSLLTALMSFISKKCWVFKSSSS
ncbi:MAG: GtrA family protein [Candidatus Omnitrophica bacterium]|nr:GtrA family protein [Candidatus Omnitrophota bacterium]